VVAVCRVDRLCDQLAGSGSKLHVVADVASTERSSVNLAALDKPMLGQAIAVKIALVDARGNTTSNGALRGARARVCVRVCVRALHVLSCTTGDRDVKVTLTLPSGESTAVDVRRNGGDLTVRN
jgi:hypothetical protein